MSHSEGLKAYRAKDYEQALSIWEKEAEGDNDQSMTNLGLMYLKGEGVTKDYKQAREWFEKASVYDNDSANYNLALMYQTKIGVDEDIEKAIDYFRKAAAKNHQSANFRLALLLLADRTKLSYVKEGFDAMLKAALSGHPMAMAQIGGIDKNPDTHCKFNQEFREFSKEKQIELIEDAIDRYVRPMLRQDGGDILLLDYVYEPDIELRLAYQGNCAGCSLGATSTYEMIYNTLSQVIDGNIRIYIL
jgi:TPR repeat protein